MNKYILNTNSFVGSINIKNMRFEFFNPNCMAEIHYYEFSCSDDAEPLHFIDMDILEIISELQNKDKPKCIINIQSIWLPEDIRNKGYGSIILKEFIESFDNANTIFITKSGPLHREYEEEPSDEIYTKENRIQAYFLEKNGFRNFNSICKFEYGFPYIYINNAVKPILREIIKSEVD